MMARCEQSARKLATRKKSGPAADDFGRGRKALNASAEERYRAG